MNKNKDYNLQVLKGFLLASTLLVICSGCTSLYKCNEKPVIEKTYYPSGKLKWESSYACRRPNGLSKVYRENGELWMEGNYTNGKKEGTWKTYQDVEGATFFKESRKEEEFKNGKLDGLSVSYDLNGKQRALSRYKNGQINYLTSFGNDGGPHLSYEFNHGKRSKVTIYRPTKFIRISWECEEKNAKLHGLCKEYYESGE